MKPTNTGSEVAAKGRLDFESSAGWRAIQSGFLATGNAGEVQRALTRAIEAAAVEAFQASLLKDLAAPVALFAVGGFARAEVFPYSHPDILVVREDDNPQTVSRSSAEFVRQLWAKGVRPSQRVFTVAECVAALDSQVDFAVKLLDRRLLAGDAGLAARLDRELAAALAKSGVKIAERLISATRARHRRFSNTPGHGQPDVEEAPGGVQDLRAIAALRKLCPEETRGVKVPEAAAAFLSSVRCFLHYRAQDDRNMLDFPAQEAYAGQFAPGVTPADWMRQFFRHSRSIYHAARHALECCETPDAGSAAGATDPPAEPLSWPALQSMLSPPHAAAALRALQDADLLPRALPEWAGIEGLIAKDAEHPYTIDEHTLMTIERVCELRDTTDTARQRFSQLIPDGEEQALVIFALLFHGMGGGAESPARRAAAAALAREAATRGAMPAEGRDLVCFLIEAETSLLDLMGGRDLDDPATIHLLAERVGTIERLRMLTILTYADLAATYSEPAILWRLDQLWRAFHATRLELTRELEDDRIREVPAALIESTDFITGFPTRYLRARSATEIRAHIGLYERSRAGGVAVELEPIEGAYRLSVVALDRPALFASFAGAISSFGLDIVRAEAFSNSKGVVLDTFVVADPRRTLSLNPSEAERLQDLMGRVAQGKTDPRRLFRNRPQTRVENPAMEPRVQFDSTASGTATLVEIVAEDRPGLLYSLATVFSTNGCNIDTVLIDTKGRRAIDVFYVAGEGGKLSPEFQASLQRQLIAACLGTNAAA